MAVVGNKCIESTPGLAAVICRRDDIEQTRIMSQAPLTLNLQNMYISLERTGQFLYTPPVQTVLALDHALQEWHHQGGISARLAKYKRVQNHAIDMLRTLDIHTLVENEKDRSCVISTFEDDRYSVDELYTYLYDRGFVIYPTKLTNNVSSFRVGHIGDITIDDMTKLVENIGEFVGMLEEDNDDEYVLKT